MHGGAPAAGHADQIAFERARGTARVAVIIDGGDVNRGDATAAVHARDRGAEAALDGGLLHLDRAAAEGTAARVNHRDLDATRMQIERGEIGTVIIREDDGATTRRDCVA